MNTITVVHAAILHTNGWARPRLSGYATTREGMAASYIDNAGLDRPLLDSEQRRGTYRPNSAAARHRLQRAAVAVLSASKAARTFDHGPPSLSAARAYMRFFLPKTADGELLPLTCSEAEFTAHVGSGVSMYMNFVKMTGWMFTAATVIVLPQIYVNMRGSALALQWPWSNDECQFPSGLPGLVGRVMSTAAYAFYSHTLGNASFAASGTVHLATEMLLCIMFCIYVYAIYFYNSRALSSLEGEAVRASDFAVLVSQLPSQGVDSQAIRAHFAFFGPIASVALSHNHDELLRHFHAHRTIKSRWHSLHAEYMRTRFVARKEGETLLPSQSQQPSQHLPSVAASEAAGCASTHAACDAILGHLVATWQEMLEARRQLKAAAARPATCTGHAVVVFRRMEHAARCVRHFERIRNYEHLGGSAAGAGDSVDFRQLYLPVRPPASADGAQPAAYAKLEVKRAPEPSDIVWAHLRFSELQRRAGVIQTSAIIFLVSCVSTVFITTATAVATMYSQVISPVLAKAP